MQLINDLQGNGGVFSKQVVGRFLPSFLDQFPAIAILLFSEPPFAGNSYLEAYFAGRYIRNFHSMPLCQYPNPPPVPRQEPISGTRRETAMVLLTIHNNWTMDTVAVLTDQNVKPLLVVYLRHQGIHQYHRHQRWRIQPFTLP